MSEVVLKLKEVAKDSFLKRPNVVGVGVGYKITKGVQTSKVAVVALVEKKKPLSALAREDRLPSSLGYAVYSGVGVGYEVGAGGYSSIPVDVVEIGRVEALSYTNRYRPFMPGVSIGHYQITAGTFGAVVKDTNSDELLLLSNNHVFANSNDALISDPILQPGPIDGGKYPEDAVARLLRFVPIDFGEESGDCPYAERFARATNYLTGVLGSKHKVKVVKQNAQAVNYVDGAVARPLRLAEVEKEILEIGLVEGTEEHYLGMGVRKTGRTTEYTEGNVTLVNATIEVNYGDGKVARFEDQIVSGYMSQGGDSGSLLVAKNSNKAVGLLYAGSNLATIYNPISRVLEQLKIKI
jgi:hypothetical protein